MNDFGNNKQTVALADEVIGGVIEISIDAIFDFAGEALGEVAGALIAGMLDGI